LTLPTRAGAGDSVRQIRTILYGERVVSMALADGQAPTGSRVVGEHRIARSTLQDALERLVADECHVSRDAGGRPYLSDPLLGEWLRRR
jgi:hypothetical protein